MKTELNIGIIGTGFGKIIGLNFKAVEPTANIFFYGRDNEKLNNAVKEVQALGTYDDWQKLIDDPKIDLVVIASLSLLHKEMYEYAAKAGKNILVEKPAALFSYEIAEMQKVHINKGKLSIVNHEGRFHPVVQYIKELIQNGKLGDILTIRSGAYLNWYSNPTYTENWNNDKTLGGGQIYSIGTHQIDLALYMLGNPTIEKGSVQKHTYQDKRFQEKATSDSQFSAQFTTEANTSVQLYCDCYCFGYKDFTIEVIGSQGIVMYSDQKGLKVSYSNTESLQEVNWVDPISEVTLGNSILTKSMKYMAKAIVEALKTGNSDNDKFCSLQDEKRNLELFEKFAL